jgi:hypothetical protein
MASAGLKAGKKHNFSKSYGAGMAYLYSNSGTVNYPVGILFI